jgi:hypothetical protein
MRNIKAVIEFEVEAADRSVGIMSEGFAAWLADGTAWCNLVSMGLQPDPSTFEWFSNETGEPVDPPAEAMWVEGALIGFADGYYRSEEP